ncbi:Something about silencing protein 10 [Cyberlindnera fabianii]|uniref:Something about silencing protein 10 n=1 Tax=Cyberlindnera fabianii TaxID=36022 RepID=A0A1V2L999_CYBFA|nr:Something about silencing protein 10 [Cyberlindnera fabianii]
MARKGRLEQRGEEDYGLDDVDSFAAAKEKILFDNATARIQGARRDEDDESEEEVMDLDSGSDVSDDEQEQEEDEDDAEFFGKKDELEEEEDEAEDGVWGQNKNAYYGDDDIENDEDARALEQEALRLQKKHLEELNMDDYVDEEMEEEWTKSAKKHDYGDVLDSTSKKETQSLSDLSGMDAKQKKKFLQQSHPEFIPLTKQLSKLKPVLDDLTTRKDDSEVANVQFTALSAYLGAIATYFSLFQSLAKEEEPFSMKEHPVMEGILSTKEVWRQASELEDMSDSDNEDQDKEMGEVSPEADSDGDVFDSASESIPGDVSISEKDDDEEDESEEEKEEDDTVPEIDIDISKPRVFKRPQAKTNEDYAEGAIADVDAEEKTARKKTLRFYTSKIDQQAKKRDEKFGGDEDLPYRERLFERQQRLIEEARKRGLHDDQGDDLNDNDSFDEQDVQAAQDVNDGFDDSYYESIKTGKLAMKSKRKQLHEDAVRAAKEGKLAEAAETVGEDGKRAINYQILKNKGLTPHRNKDNRNSRVKKRKKYEQAKKKLKSVRAVYEQPTGAYEGEKTGIKKNLSKSVKF